MNNQKKITVTSPLLPPLEEMCIRDSWNPDLIIVPPYGGASVGAVSYTHLDVYKRQILNKLKLILM